MSIHERFPYVISVDVRFRDQDSLGHANNAAYVTYFEQARVHYGLQLSGAQSARELSFILAEQTITYLRPAFFGERLLVGVRVASIGTKSFTMEYELCRESDELVARARSVQVWFDFPSNRSMAVPAHFRAAVERLQRHS